MFETLRTNSEKYVMLTDEEFDYYKSLFEFKRFKKKEYILRQGDYCDFEAFILSGCMVSFHTDKNDNKIVLNLMAEDWWVTDISSGAKRKPSLFNFQAIEQTEVLMIQREKKEELYEKYPVFDRLFRKMGQLRIGAMERRTILDLSRNADEKYLDLKRRYPDFEKRFPQYLIAGYLGISPEFLSKIRKKLNKSE